VAHVTNLDRATRALDAGIDGLVHMFIDRLPDPRTLTRMAERDVFLVATLCTMGPLAGDRTAEWLTRDERSAPLLSEEWRDNLCACWSPNPHGHLDVARDGVRMLSEAGARVLVGTDAASVQARGTAHGASVHDELRLLIESGMTPLDALRAATSLAADTYGLGDRGRIAAGKQADLVLVDGDPTADIDDTLSIDEVWRRGEALDRSARAVDQATHSRPAAHEKLERTRR